MTRLPMAMTRPTTRTMPSAMGLRFMKDSLVRGPMLVVRGSGMTSRSDGDGQVLGRQVLGDALFAALTAEAGVLHTAEGSGGVGDEPLVEADHSGLEPLPHPHGAAEGVGVRGRTPPRPIGRAGGGVTSSAPDSATRTGLAGVQACPPLRSFATIAPSTASLRSASSKTRNGAFPPSSSDRRRRFSAATVM